MHAVLAEVYGFHQHKATPLAIFLSFLAFFFLTSCIVIHIFSTVPDFHTATFSGWIHEFIGLLLSPLSISLGYLLGMTENETLIINQGSFVLEISLVCLINT